MKHEFELVIVEDCQDDAELMVRTLRKNRLANSLIVLEDGEEALDYFFLSGKYKNDKVSILPKVIFLDLKLPKVSGLEVLAQLKKNKKTKKIPIIIVSSSKQDPDINEAYRLGANSYVVKPVNFESFVSTINQLGSYWLLVNESAN